MSVVNSHDLISVKDANRLADKFESILKRHNITIATGSALERGLLLLHEIKSLHETGNTNVAWPSLREDLQEAVGMLHMVKLVVRQEDHPEFQKMVPHLKLLNETEVAQTKKAKYTDYESTKILELTVGLATLSVGNNIIIEDPKKSSKGKNPDVIINMKDGRQWAFACKVVRGDAPMSLFELIEGGVNQIQRSGVDIGIVVVSFKDQIPHSELFPQMGVDVDGTPILGAHRNPTDVVQRILEFTARRFDAMINEVTIEKIWETVGYKIALPGVLIAHVVGVGISTQVGPTASIVGFLQLYPLEFNRLTQTSVFDNDLIKSVLQEVNYGFRVL